MTNTAIGKEIGCTDVAVGYALKRRHKAQQQVADATPPEPTIQMYEEVPQEPTDSTPALPDLKELLNVGKDGLALVIDYLKVNIKLSESLGCGSVDLSRSTVYALINILEQA